MCWDFVYILAVTPIAKYPSTPNKVYHKVIDFARATDRSRRPRPSLAVGVTTKKTFKPP